VSAKEKGFIHVDDRSVDSSSGGSKSEAGEHREAIVSQG